jgi:hypothetical protein
LQEKRQERIAGIQFCKARAWPSKEDDMTRIIQTPHSTQSLITRHASLAKDANFRFRLALDGTGLPQNLDPATSHAARQAIEGTAPYFQSRLADGVPVAWVTVCHPAWLREKDELDAEVIKEALVWTRRRIQRLMPYGQTKAAGAVDVAWNDNRRVGLGRYWCVHTHFLLSVENVEENQLKPLVHGNFGCPLDPRITGNGPLHVQLLNTAQDVSETLKYASGGVALIDNNPRGGRHYRKRVACPGEPAPRDKLLGPTRQKEFTRLLHEVGPHKLTLLCGLQRHGGIVKPIMSKVSARWDAFRAADERARNAVYERDQTMGVVVAERLSIDDPWASSAISARVARIAAAYHQTVARRLELEARRGR